MERSSSSERRVRVRLAPSLALAAGFDAFAAAGLVSEARSHLNFGVLSDFTNDWSGVDAERRPGRRGRTDTYYARVARDYVELMEQGDQSPVATLARRKCLDAKTVSNLLGAARLRGLLTPPPRRGRAGGQLTEAARRLLANINEED
jgi:hypothetical protein